MTSLESLVQICDATTRDVLETLGQNKHVLERRDPEKHYEVDNGLRALLAKLSAFDPDITPDAQFLGMAQSAIENVTDFSESAFLGSVLDAPTIFQPKDQLRALGYNGRMTSMKDGLNAIAWLLQKIIALRTNT